MTTDPNYLPVEPRPGWQDIAAIGELLHNLDRCMTDEHIPGYIRRRVLNRYVWGTPDGDPDIQLAVMVDGADGRHGTQLDMDEEFDAERDRVANLDRLLQERDRLIEAACPCLPGAPRHEHLTGGYAIDWTDPATGRDTECCP